MTRDLATSLLNRAADGARWMDGTIDTDALDEMLTDL